MENQEENAKRKKKKGVDVMLVKEKGPDMKKKKRNEELLQKGKIECWFGKKEEKRFKKSLL